MTFFFHSSDYLLLAFYNFLLIFISSAVHGWLRAALIILCFGIDLVYISFYLTKYSGVKSNQISSFINKRIVCLVPHQDDEINLYGGFIKNMVQNSAGVWFVFYCNGDFNNQSSIRLEESYRVLKKYGVHKENIILMGYGELLTNEKGLSIYDTDAEKVIMSHNGRTQTYGNEKWSDFRYTVTGRHSEYTKQNIGIDILDILKKISPDIIFMCDLDDNIDHRVLSMISDEAAGKYIKLIQNDIKVFKGFSYSTAYKSVDDFYAINFKSTVEPQHLGNPYLKWSERVRFPVENNCVSYTKRGNSIYSSFGIYKSQRILHKASLAANGDKVFWERNTRNIFLHDKIFHNGHEIFSLNDFKLFGTNNLTNEQALFDADFVELTTSRWNEFEITAHQGQMFNTLRIYGNIQSESCGLDIRIMDKQSEIYRGTQVFDNGICLFEFDSLRIEESITLMLRPDTEKTKIFELEASLELPRKPEIVKLVDGFDNFIYQYYIKKNQEINISLFIYPENNAIHFNDIDVIPSAGLDVKIESDILRVRVTKNGRHLLRITCKNDDRINDEILFVSPAQAALYRSLQRAEATFDFPVNAGKAAILFCKGAARNLMGNDLYEKIKSAVKIRKH